MDNLHKLTITQKEDGYKDIKLDNFTFKGVRECKIER
ncbi:homoserine dehydrogenase [Clostridium beijerinckii]|nr:homoserine dehydrogenase [Clostridium beijerinckii]MBA8935848.1 homoserine dehydrogenase [Clostridium beijerinckii]NRU35921.1 homoserine dehydrogenase [Clostridium beijerinckii]NRU41658.1 homoserine dehydrogenase [Clostridium beijerinckii]NSB00798.1 homoserine dehydrogenase [Clostridium beijerinckii]